MQTKSGPNLVMLVLLERHNFCVNSVISLTSYAVVCSNVVVWSSHKWTTTLFTASQELFNTMFVASERLNVAVNAARLLESHAMLLAQLQMHLELETLTTASQHRAVLHKSTLRDTSFVSS